MALRIFSRFNILIYIYSFKYKTIETHARAFLPLNISVVGSVSLLPSFSASPIISTFVHE